MRIIHTRILTKIKEPEGEDAAQYAKRQILGLQREAFQRAVENARLDTIRSEFKALLPDDVWERLENQ